MMQQCMTLVDMAPFTQIEFCPHDKGVMIVWSDRHILSGAAWVAHNTTYKCRHCGHEKIYKSENPECLPGGWRYEQARRV